jgi:toxin-antitoxin system PIN domain toxin
LIAVDTNILVYAHRRDSEWHEPAAALLKRLAENRNAWAIPWPCIHEFLAIVTHPSIYDPPSTIRQAIDQAEAWLSSPSLVLLAETSDHWSRLRDVLTTGKVQGPVVHDARIVALCSTNGVAELLTADRDFGRFPTLPVRNPLLEPNGV